jgi:cephalosporin-C deacetylase-like acetyl esterase
LTRPIGAGAANQTLVVWHQQIVDRQGGNTMKANTSMIERWRCLVAPALLLSLLQGGVVRAQSDTGKRAAFLEKLIPILHLEADEISADPRISTEHQSWTEWQKQTGELPPDFDLLPACADLPDPLMIREKGREIQITNHAQWQRKRAWMREQLQHWLYGSMPPAPGNVRGTVASTRRDNRTTIQEVELAFGPEHAVKLTMQLFIPDGPGPFPTFLTQWTHRGWAQIAVRRGYLACIYAGADSKDDTFEYRRFYPDYDFLVLARRAWGASRCIDYLYTLPQVDTQRIALAGHSRNGKQSLIAAAFDDRIKAVISSSSGSGGEMPARFDRDHFYAGDMALHIRCRRSWFHPRWRFFVGRENQLPVDSNSLVACIAPNACMISTATNETEANNWAQEQVYRSAQRVYRFLGAADKLALRYRGGGHSTSARDIEDYFDFFDTVFGRHKFPLPGLFYHDYSFEQWKNVSGIKIDPAQYPEKGIDDLLLSSDGKAIASAQDWQKKAPDLRRRVRWGLGEEPPGAGELGPRTFAAARSGRPDYIADTIGRVTPQATLGRISISPYSGFGDYLYGDLYYPKTARETAPSQRLPVVIWLHPYSYNSGYGSAARGRTPAVELARLGYAMFAFDQIGFGTRVEEGRGFYQRYPHWSLMGRMVADVRAAIDALSNLDCIDPERIYCVGYSMGATVGLHAAALDPRIKGVVSVCGFSPFRCSTPAKEKANAILAKYSHLHGLMPQLGFFLDSPKRVPYDFHEVLGLVAPRPLMVVAPELDWDNVQADVRDCVKEAGKVYKLLGAQDNLHLFATYDINRWTTLLNPPSPQKEVFEWIEKHFR